MPFIPEYYNFTMIKKYVDAYFEALSFNKEDLENIKVVIDKLSSEVADVFARDDRRIFIIAIGANARMAQSYLPELEYNYLLGSGHATLIEPGKTFAVTHDDWMAFGANPQVAAFELEKYNIGEKDIVIGITSSGHNNYINAALSLCKEFGALTALITNCDDEISSDIDFVLDLPIKKYVVEYIHSFEGTTTLRMISDLLLLSSLTKAGRIYENDAVFRKQNSPEQKKEIKKSLMTITGIHEERAEFILEECFYFLAHAIIMVKKEITADQAEALLRSFGFNIHRALES